MVFYNSGNSNGKMTHKYYIDQILEPIVKPQLVEDHRFVLEEDGNSGHGSGHYSWIKNLLGEKIETKDKENLVQQQKRTNSLLFYFNCHSSPNLSPIENCQSGPKSYVNSYIHFDMETTKDYTLQG